MLQVHGTFDRGVKEARLARLMNHWGDRVSHDILVGDPEAVAARSWLDEGLSVRFLSAPRLQGKRDLAKFRALAGLMRHYDLVLSFNWEAMDAVMAHRLLRRAKGLPPLVHHEDGFSEGEGAVCSPRRNLYRRMALAGADALVVPSNELVHVAQREWRCKPDRVHQIPNCIDVSVYLAPASPGAIPGLEPDGRLVIGTLAGPRSTSSLRRLIRAVAPMKERLRLVIVGDGAEREAILAEAVAQGLGPDDVLMPALLPPRQDFLRAFDMFALSSDGGQCPIALVEAMAAGLPVVAADVGDVAAMVAADNRPFIVDPDDPDGFRSALAELAEDTDLSRRIGEANRLRARRCFDEKVMFQLYARLYGRAVGDELALL